MNFEYLGPHHSESVKTPNESGTGQKSTNKPFLNPRMVFENIETKVFL
jgi:hypothetical protein